MSKKAHDCEIQKNELKKFGETVYFQAFLDKCENCFHNNDNGFREHVLYRLPLAFGIDKNLDDVADMQCLDIHARQVLTQIIEVVKSVPIYSDEDFYS